MLIISSKEVKDTSENVIEKVREALDARKTGIQVDRVRNIRDGKILICCGNRPELEKAQSRLNARDGLNIEPAANRDPRVILRNVLSYNYEADVIESLKTQNRKFWLNMNMSHFRVKEVYQRRARNPLQAHVVLQVSPQVWRRLTEAETVLFIPRHSLSQIMLEPWKFMSLENEDGLFKNTLSDPVY